MIFLSLLLSLSSGIAHADETCRELSGYFDVYTLASKQCQDSIELGQTLEVRVSTGDPSIYIVRTGEISFAPDFHSSLDVCYHAPDGSFWYTAAQANPKYRTEFRFFGNSVELIRENCRAVFVK